MWNPFLFYSLLGVAFLVLLVGLAALLTQWRKPVVIEYRGKGGGRVFSPLDEAPSFEVFRALRLRRNLLIAGSIAVVVSLSIWSWAITSGELSHQQEASKESDAAKFQQNVAMLIAESAKVFAEPVSQKAAEEALADRGFSFEYPSVEATVVFPDGEEDTAKFIYQKSNKPYFRPATDEVTEMLNERGWKPDVDLQRSWLLGSEVSPELEKAYGIAIQPSQRADLAFPAATPTVLTRYGSTPMTTLLSDGSYFNGIVTLIWDGEFKLIGSEGTDRAAELTRP